MFISLTQSGNFIYVPGLHFFIFKFKFISGTQFYLEQHWSAPVALNPHIIPLLSSQNLWQYSHYSVIFSPGQNSELPKNPPWTQRSLLIFYSGVF